MWNSMDGNLYDTLSASSSKSPLVLRPRGFLFGLDFVWRKSVDTGGHAARLAARANMFSIC